MSRNEVPQNSGAARMQGEAGMSRRRFLAALGVGGAATVVGVREVLNNMPSLPDVPNPFGRETKEKAIETVRTAITTMAKFVPLEVTHLVTAQIEKDAKALDFLFDAKATIVVPTKSTITSDFSAFLPPKPENTNSSALAAPTTETTLPAVGMVGGVPALEISDDLSSVIVTLPHPELPKEGDILPDFKAARIFRGQGGLGDKIDNLTGMSIISDTALYKKAQKDALNKLKSEPDVIPRAEDQTRAILTALLGLKFGTNVTVNFVNISAGPELPPPLVTQVPNSRSQARAGN